MALTGLMRISTAALVASVALTSCARADTIQSSDPSAIKADNTNSKATITAAQAAEAALKAIPGGSVLDIDSGFEQGHAVWEVLVRKPDNTGVELYIQSSTGAILKQRPALVSAEAKGSSTTVTIQQASKTAVAAIPGGRLIEIDLGTEQGRTVWEALVEGPSGRSEIYIDAATGTIIKQERAD